MKTKVKRLRDFTIPKEIITGKLADNAENRAIAEENWEELERINKEKKEIKKRNYGRLL